MGGWVGDSLQTLIQLLCLPLSFRTTSGHALAAPLGIEKAQLSGRRFGQSGIKCRALFSHSAPGVGTPGDLHCAFSHTSLGGARRNPQPSEGKVGRERKERERPGSDGGERGGRDGARVRKMERGRRRRGSKTGPEAGQKSIKAAGNLKETKNSTLNTRMADYFLCFCLSACTSIASVRL